ncbi:hypothetical protein FOA52_010163 [Chlamydomonas sp. UWO 241]|nr:hypothetical protein FOA52_010163 [Chlamydomonas sp. UWO 241]
MQLNVNTKATARSSASPSRLCAMSPREALSSRSSYQNFLPISVHGLSSALAVSPRSRVERRSSLGFHSAGGAAPAATEPEHTVADAGIDYKKMVETLPRRKVLLLNDAHGSMSQALLVDLQALGHDVVTTVVPNGKEKAGAFMREIKAAHKPDVIIAPFLTKFVPEDVWSDMQVPVIVCHPGPMGDKGSNSIDWAIRNKESSWGLTMLQAAAGVDDGPVYASPNFKMQPGLTKSEAYGIHAVQAARAALPKLLCMLWCGEQPVDAGGPPPIPSLTYEQRRVDFETMTAEEVAHTIRLSDSRPGAPCKLRGVNGEYRAFEAVVEKSGADKASKGASPGQVLGARDGAVMVACADGSCVWIGRLQAVPEACAGPNKSGRLQCLPSTIKLRAELELRTAAPALMAALPKIPAPENSTPIAFGTSPSTWQQVWTWKENRVAYVNWAFYNGAMSTEQCYELQAVLEKVGSWTDVDSVVLLGGYKVFSNGIDLNTIQASADPATESWRNINAINDAIRACMHMTNKLVVTAVWGNAGAGGAIMPLVGDRILAHEGVVMNPHYKKMGLFGSEYWTFQLPARVGAAMADALSNMCQPISARQAKAINYIDEVVSCDHFDFVTAVRTRVERLVASGEASKIVAAKQAQRTPAWFAEAERHRVNELWEMSKCFPSQEFQDACNGFVFKRGSHGIIDTTSPVPPLSRPSDVRVSNVVPAKELLADKATPLKSAASSAGVSV